MHNSAPLKQPEGEALSKVLANKLLAWSLPESLVDAVIGDLEETYLLKQQQGQASIVLQYWYWQQTLNLAYRFMPTTQRGLIMFILSLVVFISMMVFGMAMGADVSAFIDVPSAMLVFPPAIFFAIAATSWHDFLFAFGCVVSEKGKFSDREIIQSKRVFSVLGNTAIWCGGITTLIGWVAMASNISAEEFSAVIGPAFAVSILTFYYGAIVKLICYVAEQRIASKMLD
jgi:chemotaxis protein MotA